MSPASGDSGADEAIAPTASREPRDAGALAARLSSLSPERRAALQRLLQKGERTDSSALGPSRRPAGALPLSFAQERLWFLERLGGLGNAYHVPWRVRLTGALDVDALRWALDRIVARHETLRTTFVAVDGTPQQVIAAAEESTFTLAMHDLSGHAAPTEALRAIGVEELAARFDLERGPLIRGRLVRLGEREYAMLVTMHHIVSDGWSVGVLREELGALYGAYLRGGDDPLPPLPTQYADYAVWQRRWVSGPRLAEQAAYWRGALAAVPELLALPTDRPRPAQQDYAGASVPVAL
ncbi:MAG: condensation domain-containing protein, partial [Pseudomonadota bacterium]